MSTPHPDPRYPYSYGSIHAQLPVEEVTVHTRSQRKEAWWTGLTSGCVAGCCLGPVGAFVLICCERSLGICGRKYAYTSGKAGTYLGLFLSHIIMAVIFTLANLLIFGPARQICVGSTPSPGDMHTREEMIAIAFCEQLHRTTVTVLGLLSGVYLLLAVVFASGGVILQRKIREEGDVVVAETEPLLRWSQDIAKSDTLGKEYST
ncbi:hypothetical protein BJ742DRAFT_864586 [Cladochytrium replicatum]|nr:hypothetical protein BJ742DRAFT_864586 [Cladochytrium replicatum]